jgi:hypothetical protein
VKFLGAKSKNRFLVSRWLCPLEIPLSDPGHTNISTFREFSKCGKYHGYRVKTKPHDPPQGWSQTENAPSVHVPHPALFRRRDQVFFHDNSFQNCPLLDSNPLPSQTTLIAKRKTNLYYCISESCNGAQEVEDRATNSLSDGKDFGSGFNSERIPGSDPLPLPKSTGYQEPEKERVMNPLILIAMPLGLVNLPSVNTPPGTALSLLSAFSFDHSPWF